MWLSSWQSDSHTQENVFKEKKIDNKSIIQLTQSGSTGSLQISTGLCSKNVFVN